MAHSAITTPAMMRAALTRLVPLRVPCDRRIESAARAASTRATIVPTIGRMMLTIAQTRAAMANGSVRGASPQPPDPSPPTPVGSGSGPTGTAPVSSGPHPPGGTEDIGGTLATSGAFGTSPPDARWEDAASSPGDSPDPADRRR